MLLARKKINRIAKWFAIVLAAIFALSGVVLGVGSKTGNVFAGCAQSSSSGLSANSSFADRESYLKGQIKKNPNDTDSMLQLASLYAGDNVKRYKDAITWYQKYLAIDPKSPQSIEVRLDMGQTYVKMNDTASAIKIDTEATTVDPTDAQAFLELGDVAKGQQNQVAINAWNRYLQLTPNSPYASDIKAEIDTLSHPATAPSTTVPAATPTTGH
ncbi:MAG: tetratricopeptide repeat protein [Actinobacteria bacterium]|nr:tetratricopeptide repeat protein [Actinomycetota bacterium]